MKRIILVVLGVFLLSGHSFTKEIQKKIRAVSTSTIQDINKPSQYGKSHYRRINNTVFFLGMKTNADAESFNAIDPQYYEFGKDKNSVYFREAAIAWADTKSFHVLNQVYSKDDQNIYFRRYPVKNADLASFKPVAHQFKTGYTADQYAVDKSYVYYKGVALSQSDPNSFVFVGNYGDYAKDKGQVYNGGRVLSYMDSASFILLSNTDYVKDKNGIYFKNQKIEGADVASFQVMKDVYGLSYAKDKKAVYVNGKIIPNAHSGSFRFLEANNRSRGYAQDKDHIYYNAKVIQEADRKSFELFDLKDYISAQYARDKNYIYHEGKIETRFDVATFKNFGCGYISDGQNLYRGRSTGEQVFSQIDPSSFEVLYCGVPLSVHDGVIRVYTKDKNKVYFNNKSIPDADPSTFMPLENQKDHCYYAKDKNRLYKNEKPVSTQVDLATFNCLSSVKSDNTHLDGIQYTQDKNQIYYSEIPIQGADHQTFKVIDVDYALDKNHVYYRHQVIQGANPNEFKVLPYPQHLSSNAPLRKLIEYGRDKNTIYFKNTKLLGADPNSFELLTDPNIGDDQYVKDKQYVYLAGKRLVGADPKTFEVFKNHSSIMYKGLYAKDKKNIYFGNQLVKGAQTQYFQPVSFGRFDSGYYRDQRSLYYNGKILNNVDFASFEKADEDGCNYDCLFKDRQFLYFNGERLPVDFKTFALLPNGYFKDKKYVYFKGRQGFISRVNGADVSSFKAINNSPYGYYSGGYALKEDAKDKFFIYEKGQRVSDIKP